MAKRSMRDWLVFFQDGHVERRQARDLASAVGEVCGSGEQSTIVGVVEESAIVKPPSKPAWVVMFVRGQGPKPAQTAS